MIKQLKNKLTEELFDRQLIEKYEISYGDALLCELIHIIRRSNTCIHFLAKYSEKKYGQKDNLGRYWYERFCGITIGKYTYGYRLNTMDVESIGAFCSIGDGQRIVNHDHVIDYVTTSPITLQKKYGFIDEEITPPGKYNNGKLTIGNDVWIGERCTIFKGVTIGDGAIIGANSIIRKDVPPYAIVVGVDRIVRYRFNKRTIDKIQRTKWWEWSDDKIRQNIALLRNTKNFVKEADASKGDATQNGKKHLNEDNGNSDDEEPTHISSTDKNSSYFVKFAAITLVLSLMNLVYKPAFTVAMIVFSLAVGFFYYKNKVVPKIEVPTMLLYSLGMFFVTMFICALFAGHIKSNFAGAFEQFYLAFPFFMLLSLQSLVDVRKEIKYSLAAVTVGQFFYMGYDYLVHKIPRPNGFLGNANNSAEMLGLVLPFFVYFAIIEKDFSKRIFWIFVAVADFLALCMTRCRGELLSVGFLFIPVGLWLIYRYSREDILLGIAVALGICAVGYGLFDWRGSSDMHRVYVYTSAFNMWKDHMLCGVGFGEWESVYNSAYRLKTEVQGLFHAHNMYLMFLSATGIIGTISFLNIFMQMYQIFWCNIKKYKKYYLVGFVGLSLFLLHGVTDSTFSIRYITRFTWMMFAIYLLDYNKKDKEVDIVD